MADQLSPQETAEVINEQLSAWRKKMESHRIGAIVGKKIEDAELEKFNLAQMTKCVVAIETLEAMLKDVSTDASQS